MLCISYGHMYMDVEKRLGKTWTQERVWTVLESGAQENFYAGGEAGSEDLGIP